MIRHVNVVFICVLPLLICLVGSLSYTSYRDGFSDKSTYFKRSIQGKTFSYCEFSASLFFMSLSDIVRYGIIRLPGAMHVATGQ